MDMTGRYRVRRGALVAAAVAAGLFATQQARAQLSGRPNESVTVTAPKIAPDAVIDKFVQIYAAPSPAIGKIARWRDGICPAVAGLPKRSADFVVHRLRQIAAQAGAPVAADAACPINLQIMVTTEPQKLMDNVRKEHSLLLGFRNSPEETPSAAFTHPVQAWYATDTEDLRGMRRSDAKTIGIGMPLSVTIGGAVQTLYLPYAHAQAVEATRLAEGLRSDIDHALIVVDPDKLLDLEMGALSDYIAMLALSQSGAYDACLTVPSITNLLSPGCDASRKPDAITNLDLAYLRALYRMDAGGTLLQQRGSIAYQMKKTLADR